MSKLILIEGVECGFTGKVAIIVNNVKGIYEDGKNRTLFDFDGKTITIELNYEEVLEKIKEQIEQ
jgi:hypothetical protein